MVVQFRLEQIEMEECFEFFVTIIMCHVVRTCVSLLHVMFIRFSVFVCKEINFCACCNTNKAYYLAKQP